MVKLWLLLCSFLAVFAFAGTQNGKFTVAFWGDCRSNGGNAEINICGHILKDKGTIYDVTFNDGDFTEGGTAAAWTQSLGRTNVSAVAKTKDFFFMCSGNHDANGNTTVYQANMGAVLPSNGTNCFYYHKEWNLPNSSRKLHLCVSDFELGSTTSAEQTYFNTQLANAGPDDWIVDLIHPPTWSEMTYKSDAAAGVAMEKYFRGKGGDFVLNGHAHVFCRTHVLSTNASGRPVIADTCKGSYRKTPDNVAGMIHIVNGRGGNFDANPKSGWTGHAFAPNLSDQVGLVTKLEFDDNKVIITTMRIGGSPNYDGTVIDGPFTWERGPATSTAVTPKISSRIHDGTLKITQVRNTVMITTGIPGIVSVYDLKGKLIRNLSIGSSGTGIWDCMDLRGNRAVNGSYIFRENNRNLQTQATMTLVR